MIDIKFMNTKAAKYYNRKHQEPPSFREGEKVWLLRRNKQQFKIKRLCDKLDHKKLGPFKILRRLGLLNFELELPRIMKVHLIFHVALLKKANQNTIPGRVEIESDTQEYQVEKILDDDLINSQRHWLVK